ncbi:hypothetical protein IKG29_02225 [Candidatus Saccharibacteria bacterium]|nr:hypothetical protein [Candidatus Saccharibacteria bacterium]
MLHQISVHLTLDDSEQLRQLLEKNGFVTYKVDRLTQKLERSNSKIVDVTPNRTSNEYYICMYNGDKSLEDMHIDIKKLEEHPAFIYIAYHSIVTTKTNNLQNPSFL